MDVPHHSFWICVRCGLPELHSAGDVHLDDFGFYFLCQGCGRRNKLQCVPGPGQEASKFVQLKE